MKKIILLIIVFVITQQTHAQVSFGAKAGLNYVNVKIVTNVQNPSGELGSKYRLGYHFGLYGTLDINEKFSINPELVFSNKGYKFDENPMAINPSGGGNLNLNYINLPFMFGFKPTKKLKLLLGPEFGYLISAKSKFKSETINVNHIWDKKFDFAAALGVSYSIADNTDVSLKYIHGFAPLFDVRFRDEMGNETNEYAKPQNRTFQFSVAYKLK